MVHVCAGLLCRDARILLAKRAPGRQSYPNVWDIPGGHCESGESWEETLVRELREELGVTPTAWEHLSTFRFADAAREPVELCVSLVTMWQGEARNLLPQEHDEIGWFTVEEACRLDLATFEYVALFHQVVQRGHAAATESPTPCDTGASIVRESNQER